jgi:N6-adenosine-specific RNA methylase IME4
MTPLALKGYRVVLADPPWLFENYSVKGEEKNPVAHYDCMPLPRLRGLGRELGLDFAMAPDCACVMWATFPMLPEAIDLLAAWGFRYKSGGAWAKLTTSGKLAFGTGYLYRSAAELWLLGTRGAPKIKSRSVRNLVVGDGAESVGPDEWGGGCIAAPTREHSRKPDAMHQSIEALFDGPYLELFARSARPGWDVWGNETGKFAP